MRRSQRAQPSAPSTFLTARCRWGSATSARSSASTSSRASSVFFRDARISRSVRAGPPARSSLRVRYWGAESERLIESIVLFLIIFLWTPPHFWALALYKQGDYGAAGIPMLPNVAGERVTKVQILVYSVILVASTLVPSFTGFMGPIYTTAAIVTGAGFLWLSYALFRTR